MIVVIKSGGIYLMKRFIIILAALFSCNLSAASNGPGVAPALIKSLRLADGAEISIAKKQEDQTAQEDPEVKKAQVLATKMRLALEVAKAQKQLDAIEANKDKDIDVESPEIKTARYNNALAKLLFEKAELDKKMKDLKGPEKKISFQGVIEGFGNEVLEASKGAIKYGVGLIIIGGVVHVINPSLIPSFCRLITRVVATAETVSEAAGTVAGTVNTAGTIVNNSIGVVDTVLYRVNWMVFELPGWYVNLLKKAVTA